MFSSEDELASDLLNSRLSGLVYIFRFLMRLKVRCISYFVIFFFVQAHTHTHTHGLNQWLKETFFSTNSATDDKILELMLFRNYLI